MSGSSTLQQREVDLHRAVAYILASIDEPRLRAKTAAVHEAFYAVTKADAGLLPGIAFSERAGTPYSKALEGVLFCLASSGLLSYRNPTYDYMSMDEKVRERVKTQYGPGLHARREKLEAAAKLLAEKLAA